MIDPRLRPPDDDLAAQLDASRRHWHSEGRDGAPLVAPHADLRSLDLGEAVLAEAQLQGADLRGARLDHALMLRAALDGARLDGAHLFAADASRASLVGATLERVEAIRSRWTRAELTRASFSGANLTDATFARADVIDAVFDSAVLCRADFSSAIAVGASFQGADVGDMNIDGAVVLDDAFVDAVSADLLRGQAIAGGRLSGVPQQTVDDTTELERRVAEILERQGSTFARAPLSPAPPDFLISLSGGRHVAIEVKGTLEPSWLDVLDRSVDAVVVPERSVRPDRPQSLAVLTLDELPRWLEAQSAGARPFAAGSLTAAMREVQRLRPYVALARQQQVDRSLIERLGAWLDSRRDPALLKRSDHRLAELIPAHLDGRALYRAVGWAERHLHELEAYEKDVRELWKAPSPSAEAAHALAVSGWQLERKIADAALSR